MEISRVGGGIPQKNPIFCTFSRNAAKLDGITLDGGIVLRLHVGLHFAPHLSNAIHSENVTRKMRMFREILFFACTCHFFRNAAKLDGITLDGGMVLHLHVGLHFAPHLSNAIHFANVTQKMRLFREILFFCLNMSFSA